MSDVRGRHLDSTQLLRYLDRELPAVEARTAEAHVEECAQCAAELARIRETLAVFEEHRKSALTSMPPSPLWPDLHAGFRRIDERAERRWFRLPLKPAASLLAAAAVGAAIYTWNRPAPAPRRAPEGTVAAPAVPATAPPAKIARRGPAPPQLRAQADPAHVELEVLAALRSVDADLGEPLEIQPSGAGARVTGTGIPPQRRGAISGALEGIGGVDLRFEDLPAQGPAAIGPPSEVRSGAPAFERELLKHFGRRAALTGFTEDILARSDAMMARAYALRNLDERFPAERRRKLSAEDLATFRQLREAHLRAIEEQVRETDRLIAPVAAALGAPEAAPDTRRVAGGIEVLERVRRFDRALNVLLAGAGSNWSQTELLAELSAARAALKWVF